MPRAPNEDLLRVISEKTKTVQKTLEYGAYAVKKSAGFVDLVLSRTTREIIAEHSQSGFNIPDLKGEQANFLLKVLHLRFAGSAIIFAPFYAPFANGLDYFAYRIQSSKDEDVRKVIPTLEIYLQREDEGGEWVYPLARPGDAGTQAGWWENPTRFRVFGEEVVDQVLIETFKP